MKKKRKKAKKLKLRCVDCGGAATHLHGNRMGLEPCCGQHEDCSP